LFGGSIRENIAYGRPGASEDDIIAAAKKANAHEYISKLPEGYDTIVGDRGTQLSGGQRQRLAIARAILADPAILILDEATSSLDAESERLVQDALDKLMENRTSIIIAHRLSTVRRCDQILAMSGGAILERGTHDELINKPGGLYSSLAKLQLE
jgi:ATP-binding cassette subfamily B protein